MFGITRGAEMSSRVPRVGGRGICEPAPGARKRAECWHGAGESLGKGIRSLTGVNGGKGSEDGAAGDQAERGGGPTGSGGCRKSEDREVDLRARFVVSFLVRSSSSSARERLFDEWRVGSGGLLEPVGTSSS